MYKRQTIRFVLLSKAGEAGISTKITREDMAEAIEELRRPLAVSYTHLDVYKRQSGGRGDFFFILPAREPCFFAVSYTHLDVYKRQEQQM